MPVVLDTAAHAPADRADLVQDVIARSGVRRRIALRAPAERAEVRVAAWDLGATPVLHTVGTAMTLTRTARDVRADAPEVVALALAGSGCTYAAHGTEQVLGPDAIVVVDVTAPYAFSHVGPAMDSFTTHIARTDLGVGVDDLRAAVPRLAASPLLPLVRGHLLRLRTVMDEVADDPAVAADLSAATVDLTRALVASAAGGARHRDVRHETLRARVVAHVRTHLGDRDLTPSGIAAAHHVSLRLLYTVWGDRDGTLNDWILRERLDRARRDLARPAARATIATVARRWGFADQSHFTRRFRAAYGVTPGEWRAHAGRPGITR